MDIYTQVLPALPPPKKFNVTWNQSSVNYDFFFNKKQIFLILSVTVKKSYFNY